MPVVLRERTGGRWGPPISVAAREFLVGSDHSCHLRVGYPGIGPRHCRIVTEGHRIVVEDLDSAAGTALNDSPIRQPIEVRHGDMLRVGPAQFQFQIAPADDPAPSASVGAPREDHGPGARPADGPKRPAGRRGAENHPETMVDFLISDLIPAPPECATTSFEQQADPPAPATAERTPAPAPAQTSKHLRLRALNGKSKGLFIVVRERKFMIGRDPSCQLRPQSQWISWVHACIEQKAGKVFVCDLGSTNGTVVNGRMIRGEEVEVDDGALLELGPLQFLFAFPHGSAANAPPRPPVAAAPAPVVPAPAPPPPMPTAPPGGPGPGPAASNAAAVNPLADLQFTHAFQAGLDVRLVSPAERAMGSAPPWGAFLPPAATGSVTFEQILQWFLMANGRGWSAPPAMAAPPPNVPLAAPAAVAPPPQAPLSRVAAPTYPPDSIPVDADLAPAPAPGGAAAPAGPVAAPIASVAGWSPGDQDILIEALLKKIPVGPAAAPPAPAPEPVRVEEPESPLSSELLEAFLEEVSDEPDASSDFEIEALSDDSLRIRPETQPNRGPQRSTEHLKIDIECPACSAPGVAFLNQLGHLFTCKACGANFSIDAAGQVSAPQKVKPPKKPDVAPPRKPDFKKKDPPKKPRKQSIDLIEGAFNGWQDVPQTVKVRSTVGLLVVAVVAWVISALFVGDALESRSRRAVEVAMRADEEGLKGISAPKTSADAVRWMQLVGPVVKQKLANHARTNVEVASQDPQKGVATVMVYLQSAAGAAGPAVESDDDGPPRAGPAPAPKPAGVDPKFLVLMWVKDSGGSWMLEGTKTLQDATRRMTPPSGLARSPAPANQVMDVRD